MGRTSARWPILAAGALAIATAAGGVALAQTGAPPSGTFGGGAIGVPVSEKTIAKDMLLSIRAQPGGRVGIDGQMFASCGIGALSGETKLAADGSFALRGSLKRRPLIGVHKLTTFSVRGRLTAEGGEGSARMTLRIVTKGHTQTCKSRVVGWTARRPIDTNAAAAPAPADATLYGLTSQKGPLVKHPIVLHTGGSGRRVERLTFGFRATCSQGRIIAIDDANPSPEFDVAADGSFRDVERFRVAYADVIARTTVVVRGQFDESGGAAGKLSVTQRYASRKSGKSVDVCRTGTRAWSAHT